MTASKTVYPWDIVVNRVGDKLYYDKRDGSKIGTPLPLPLSFSPSILSFFLLFHPSSLSILLPSPLPSTSSFLLPFPSPFYPPLSPSLGENELDKLHAHIPRSPCPSFF